MASSKITYTTTPEGDDVIKTNFVSILDRQFQATAEDFNEIAVVVNENADLLDSAVAQIEENSSDILVIQNTMVTQDMISTNISLYPTSAVGDYDYLIMVASQQDPNYNVDPVDIQTGEILADNQVVAELIADAGIFVGTIENISINTIVPIAKVSGSAVQYCSFYFKVFVKDEVGYEILIGTSSPTGPVNEDDDDYHIYNASALISSATLSITDRIVIRYYVTAMNVNGAFYKFQFGGLTPLHTDIPIPITVSVTNDRQVNVNAEGFTGVLSPEDNRLDKALETIDKHNHSHDSLAGIDQGNIKHLSEDEKDALLDYKAKTIKRRSGSLGVGKTLILEIPMTSGYGAVIEYALITTTDTTLRVGLMYVGWNGSNVKSSDTSTVDLGDSTETFKFHFEIVGPNVLFESVVTSGVFVVECSIRLI